MATSFVWTIFFPAFLLTAPYWQLPCRCSKPGAIPTGGNTLSSNPTDSRDSDVNFFFLLFSLHLSAQGECGSEGGVRE